MTDQRHDDTHAGDAASIIPAEYEYSTLTVSYTHLTLPTT